MATDTSNMKAWFNGDIQRLLVGLNEASMASAVPCEFRAGFVAALRSVALVVGANPDTIHLSLLEIDEILDQR